LEYVEKPQESRFFHGKSTHFLEKKTIICFCFYDFFRKVSLAPHRVDRYGRTGYVPERKPVDRRNAGRAVTCFFHPKDGVAVACQLVPQTWK
jgi:hypothetical protein